MCKKRGFIEANAIKYDDYIYENECPFKKVDPGSMILNIKEFFSKNYNELLCSMLDPKMGSELICIRVVRAVSLSWNIAP